MFPWARWSREERRTLEMSAGQRVLVVIFIFILGLGRVSYSSESGAFCSGSGHAMAQGFGAARKRDIKSRLIGPSDEIHAWGQDQVGQLETRKRPAAYLVCPRVGGLAVQTILGTRQGRCDVAYQADLRSGRWRWSMAGIQHKIVGVICGLESSDHPRR